MGERRGALSPKPQKLTQKYNLNYFRVLYLLSHLFSLKTKIPNLRIFFLMTTTTEVVLKSLQMLIQRQPMELSHKKNVSSKISQNLQDNTCIGVLFLIKLRTEATGVLL